ncbi:MAG: HDIG domain-containing protein, partial [Verrucomicrobiae bacterium]|nr:HDIG domain-containing protein [Verrucomicrobiae bacterium]
LAIALAELLCIGSLAAMTHTKFDALWPQVVAGLANGAFTIFLASGLLPVFEYLFKLTTDIRLLELSDLHHPLLRKLCFAAPGTYHHSLVVGNLAESAAEAIGANPLLARVCAYYHDIGKAEQPQFFSENQTTGVNPHDSLAPSESFQIIAEHIRAGEELARKYPLSPPIVDAIRQHHGTTLLRTIYMKAARLAEEAAAIVRPFSAGKTTPSPVPPPDEQDFRYAGPKPQFRESAIVFLADPIESASRTLPNASPETVRAMVERIINQRFQDGQLDECNLTLRELRVIAERFTHTLLNMLHTRIPYPTDETAAPAEAARQPEQPSAPFAPRQEKSA